MKVTSHFLAGTGLIILASMLCTVTATPVFLTEFKLTPVNKEEDYVSQVLVFLDAIGLHFLPANITLTVEQVSHPSSR